MSNRLLRRGPRSGWPFLATVGHCWPPKVRSPGGLTRQGFSYCPAATLPREPVSEVAKISRFETLRLAHGSPAAAIWLCRPLVFEPHLLQERAPAWIAVQGAEMQGGLH